MKHIKKGILFFIGIILIVLGMIGLVTPFLQGILFIIIGIYILSLAHKPFGERVERFIKKFPRVEKIHNEIKGKITRNGNTKNTTETS